MNPRQAQVRGRMAARRMMVDRVDLRRRTGGWTEDDNGNSVPATETLHTDVRAWIKVLPQQSRIVEVGGEMASLHAYDVLIPLEVDGIQHEDLVAVTSSKGTDLQGRTLTIVEVTWGTFQVGRRLVCRSQMAGA